MVMDFRLDGKALVLTDVDDTLLPLSGSVSDSELMELSKYLRKLRALGVEVVPVTLETLRRLETLSTLLNYDFIASIVEGGCVITAKDDFIRGVTKSLGAYRAIELCSPIRCFEDILMSVENHRECLGRVLRFSKADPNTVSEILEIPVEVVREAQSRYYSEIFITSDKLCRDSIARLVSSVNLQVIRTRRAIHVLGSSKGRAVKTFINAINTPGRNFITIGVGDSEADGDFLVLTDIPVITSNDETTWFKRAQYLRGLGSPPKSWITSIKYALGIIGIHT